MDAWIANFQIINPDVTVNYDPSGSGAGREIFLAGGVLWAGSDAALSDDEAQRSLDRCGPDGAIDLPVYISPIAITFNLPGIDTLNMAPATIAKIFTGQITAWDDPILAADNPGVTLPSTRVTPVHRTDNSGTTENFADYLFANVPDVWPWEPSGTWPRQGGDSAQGTSGVIAVVNQTEGAVTYADASRVGELSTANILVGGTWVPVSADAASRAVDVSPQLEGRHEADLSIALDRTTEDTQAYPLVLISYAVVCLHYESERDAEFVTEFIGFIASPLGQTLASSAAGSAPMSDDLEQRIATSVAAITSGGTP
jgi:phosphate transport system substrate-binding protein